MLWAFFTHQKATASSPWSVFLSRLNSSNSAYLYSVDVPDLWSFFWPLSAPGLTGPCLSCTGDPRARCSTLDGVSWEQRGKTTFLDPLAMVLLMQHRMWLTGFLGCKHILPAYAQFFICQYPPVVLHRAAVNPFIPPVYTGTGGSSKPSVGPCAWPCWTSWCFLACWGPTEWQPFPQANQLHHSPCCHLQICWRCTQSH